MSRLSLVMMAVVLSACTATELRLRVQVPAQYRERIDQLRVRVIEPSAGVLPNCDDIAFGVGPALLVSQQLTVAAGDELVLGEIPRVGDRLILVDAFGDDAIASGCARLTEAISGQTELEVELEPVVAIEMFLDDLAGTYEGGLPACIPFDAIDADARVNADIQVRWLLTTSGGATPSAGEAASGTGPACPTSSSGTALWLRDDAGAELVAPPGPYRLEMRARWQKDGPTLLDGWASLTRCMATPSGPTAFAAHLEGRFMTAGGAVASQAFFDDDTMDIVISNARTTARLSSPLSVADPSPTWTSRSDLGRVLLPDGREKLVVLLEELGQSTSWYDVQIDASDPTQLNLIRRSAVAVTGGVGWFLNGTSRCGVVGDSTAVLLQMFNPVTSGCEITCLDENGVEVSECPLAAAAAGSCVGDSDHGCVSIADDLRRVVAVGDSSAGQLLIDMRDSGYGILSEGRESLGLGRLFTVPAVGALEAQLGGLFYSPAGTQITILELGFTPPASIVPVAVDARRTLFFNPSVVAGDIDGDGTRDLVATEILRDPITGAPSAAGLVIILGRAIGGEPLTMVMLEPPLVAVQPLITDMTGDGRDDIVLAPLAVDGLTATDRVQVLSFGPTCDD